MVEQLLLQGEEPLIVLQLRGAWVWHLVDCQSSGGWTFYQYFFWDWGLAALCGLLPWPPWWLERVLCQLCWSPQCREEGGENPCSVSVWQTLSTWSVLWLSRLRPWRFLQYMRSCIHLPYTPSGRLDPSFGCWRSCPLGASALISGCWLLWNILVLVCTWRFSWKIHLILENMVLKCRNVIVSHSLFQDELVDLVSPTSPAGWSSTVDSCCSGAPCWGALFPWLEFQGLNRHSQLYPLKLLQQLSWLRQGDWSWSPNIRLCGLAFCRLLPLCLLLEV